MEPDIPSVANQHRHISKHRDSIQQHQHQIHLVEQAKYPLESMHLISTQVSQIHQSIKKPLYT